MAYYESVGPVEVRVPRFVAWAVLHWRRRRLLKRAAAIGMLFRPEMVGGALKVDALVRDDVPRQVAADLMAEYVVLLNRAHRLHGGGGLKVVDRTGSGSSQEEESNGNT